MKKRRLLCWCEGLRNSSETTDTLIKETTKTRIIFRYTETFTLEARLEAIRILISFAAFVNFKLYQMDVKCAFLNDFLDEEVFGEQPPSL